MTPELVEINGRWPVWLAPHRAARPEWPTWEAERLAAMRDTIRPGDTVFDVGAEEGDLPALYATWDAHLFLIEPNPKVWPNIRYHWHANRLDPPAGMFVGMCDRTTDLYPSRLDYTPEYAADGWPAVAHGPIISDHGFRHLKDGSATTLRIRLDDLVTITGTIPDVITLDVEGGELAVLEGARRTLERYRPVVFCSIHPTFLDEMYGESPGQVHGLMVELGYEASHLATDHEEHWRYVPR